MSEDKPKGVVSETDDVGVEPQAETALAQQPSDPVKVLPTEEEMGTIETICKKLGSLVGTDFMPEKIKTPEAAFAIMLKGVELGVPPMAALAQIFMVKGKCAMETDLMAALAARSKVIKWEVLERTDKKCSIKFTRTDMGTDMIVDWTEADAEKAGLLSKQGPWQQYRAVMLQKRAMSTGLRIMAPDILAGVYDLEEVGFDPEGPTVLDLTVHDAEAVASPGVDADGVVTVDWEEGTDNSTALPVPLSPAEKMAEAEKVVVKAMPAMAEAELQVTEDDIATAGHVTQAFKDMGVPTSAVRPVKEFVGGQLWPDGAPKPFGEENHQKLFSYVELAQTFDGLPSLVFTALCVAQGLEEGEIEVPPNIETAPAADAEAAGDEQGTLMEE